MANKPTYIDLFAGCGGLSLGLHNAGWQGLFAVEKSPDAFKTLKHNLIDSKKHFQWPSWLGNPTNMDINELIGNHQDNLVSMQGQVDMVVGGPPCQGFSTAGRRNENDQRNSLVKSYIKFIRLIKPKILFFENVKGFTQEFKKNKDKGKKYASYVEGALARAGYHVKGELINFGDFGIPQKRTRFILVGVRKDLPNSSKETAERFFSALEKDKMHFLSRKGLTIETNLKEAISDLLKSNGTIASQEFSTFQEGKYFFPQSPYQVLMRAGCKDGIVDSHRFANHRKRITDKFEDILGSCTRGKNVSAELRKKYDINKHTVIPLDGFDKSPTITSLPDDYIHYCEARILTVREYARIQSFPDWYEFKGKYTTGGKERIKEVPRYTQIGNAIPPLFGEQSGLVLKQLIT